MKKTVVTTVRARPVFRGAVSVTEGFISSRASITDFAEEPGTDRTASEFPAKCAGNSWQSCQSPEGIHEQPRHQWRIELLHPSETFGGLRGTRGVRLGDRQDCQRISGKVRRKFM